MAVKSNKQNLVWIVRLELVTMLRVSWRSSEIKREIVDGEIRPYLLVTFING